MESIQNGRNRPQSESTRRLSEEAWTTIVQIKSTTSSCCLSPNDKIPMRFLAKHDISNTEQGVSWPCKRPSADWNSVQKASSHTEAMCLTPGLLGEHGLAHMRRQLEKVERDYGRKRGVPGRFEIDAVENILSVDSIRRYQVVEKGSSWLPAWGFHSSEATSVDSIASYGLLAAGDIHPLSGHEILMKHGILYGEGSYLAPNLDLTVLYAGSNDERGILQTVLCLTTFGEVRHLKFPCLSCKEDFDSERDLRLHSVEMHQQAKGANASKPNAPKGVHFSSYGTIVSQDQGMWIVRDRPNSRILPVVIVRFYWAEQGWSPARFFSWTKVAEETDKTKQHAAIENAEGFFPVAAIVHPDTKTVEKMYWGLCFRPSSVQTISKVVQTHLFLLCERGAAQKLPGDATGRALGRGLADFVTAVNPASCNLLTFGGDSLGGVDVKRNITASFFTSSAFSDLVHANESDECETFSIAESLSRACVDAAGDACDGYLDRFEREWLAQVKEAENRMFTPRTPPMSDHQSVPAFCRVAVQACVSRAEEIESGLRVGTERALWRAKEQARPEERYLFVLVFHSDEIAENTGEGKSLLFRASKYLEGSELKGFSRVLKVGNLKSKPVEALNASWCLSTVVHPARNLVYSAESSESLHKGLTDIREEMLVASQSSTWTLSVPASTALGDGFLISPDLPPSQLINLADMGDVEEQGAVAERMRTIFFVTRGETPPPKCVFLNDYIQKVLPLFLHRLPAYRSLTAFRTLSLSARAMAARGRSVSEFLSLGDGLVEDAAKIQVGESQQQMIPAISNRVLLLGWMRDRKRMVTSITLAREVLNEIRTASQMFSSNSIAPFCEWLIKPLSWKFGKRALKRSILPLGVDSMDEETLVELARQELLGMNKPAEEQLSLMELLYSVPLDFCTGIRCKVAKTEVAVVDPFLVKVEFVSGERIESTCEVMCELDAMVLRKDRCWSARVPDALLVQHVDVGRKEEDIDEGFRKGTRMVLFRAFNAIIVTRNPTLQVPDQHLALLFASLVRSCEQLMRWRDLPAKRNTTTAMSNQKNSPSVKTLPDFTESIVVPFIETTRLIFYTLVSLCNEERDGDSSKKRVRKRIAQLIAGLELDETEFPTWLPKGESNGVSSVCEALAVLACNKRLLNNIHSRPMIAVAILAEAVARQIRVAIHKSAETARLFIRKALGITLASCPSVADTANDASDVIDVPSGFAFTVEFFSRPCPTNCSPFGVVATLGICELLWEGADSSTVFNALLANRVSMKSFVDKFLPSVPPKLLQTALFAQGVVAYTNADRAAQALTLVQAMATNPKALLQKLAREERLAVYRDRMADMRARMRAGKVKATKELRLKLVSADQELFLAQHSGAPRVFAPGEIAILNRERPGNDQLELDLSSCLLKHHCCFESCPEFLKNQQTEKDRWTGKRHGMFKHLRMCLLPKRVFVNSLHVMSKSFIVERDFRKVKCSRKEYTEHFSGLYHARKWSIQFHDENQFVQFLNSIYDQWTKTVEDCARPIV